MCGLCGTLGGGAHWTDGVADGDPDAAALRMRRQARRARIALGNQILRRYGLGIEDWQGRDYVLRGRTGATAIVGSLEALWREADRLCGRPVDPLDPALLDALDAGSRA